MPLHSLRAPATFAPATFRAPLRCGGAVIEPMLPALVRGVIFFCALATPFVVALLVG